MLRLIKNIPFYAFAIAPVLILFLFIHNYDSASFYSTIRSYIVCFVVSTIIFCISYFLLKKDVHKAGVITGFIMAILFFYGFIYELAQQLYYKGWWPFSEIHRFLILTILSSILVLMYFSLKRKKTFKSFTYYCNSFVIILLIINFLNLINSIIDYKKTTEREHPPITQANDSMPDIYYIILDAYANDSILSQVYGYPQNTLTQYLKKENFFVAPLSKTNYISTSPSLSSSLNLGYLDTAEIKLEKNRDYIYNNDVSNYLQSKGYKIVHIRSGYSVTRENYNADTTIMLNNLGEFERTLLKYTILRLDDVLGYLRYKTLKEQLSVMYGVFNVKGPKYVFLHIVSPHPPYICDEFGNFKAGRKISEAWWEPKSDYLAQLKYINKEVINFVEEIFKKSSNQPIIIIQSDHGPWISSNSFYEIYEARSKILNSYYIPYNWKNKLYPTITPVNSFRVIFNELFNDSLEILKDIPLDSVTTKKYLPKDLLKTIY